MSQESPKYLPPAPAAVWAARMAVQDMGKDYLSALLLDGFPGCGKTFLGKMMAREMGAKLISFQFFPGCGRDELLFANEKSRGGELVPGVLVRAIQESHLQPTVLLCDEMDKVPTSIDAFFLNFLNENLLYVPVLGELKANSNNLLVVLSKNAEREASEPLARRCRYVYMGWPPREREVEIAQTLCPDVNTSALEFLIDEARELRQKPTLKKKPSPPEVCRLARDLHAMTKQNASESDLGNYLVMGLVPFMTDRGHFDKNPLYLGKKWLEKLHRN